VKADMIKLQPQLLYEVNEIGGLRRALQQALQLEHATIPPYLYTAYSLNRFQYPAVYNMIVGIAEEEMGHFALVCNILNAIGGAPDIDTPAFPMTYPGPLPGAINEGLTVTLEPFSTAHVKAVFMEIEEPEEPLDFKVAFMPTDAVEYATIGQFYSAIRAALETLGPGIFTGDPARQVTSEVAGLPHISAVTNLDDAVAAIELIVEQGEGTTESPTDDDARLAHYYRFAELFYGRRLVRNPAAGPAAPPAERYIYAGDPISVDPSDVLPLRRNPKVSDFPPEAREQADEFNRAYTDTLRALHDGFNGRPQSIAHAIELMRVDLTPLALALVQMPLPDGTRAGPTFEYVL
jgi:rubrerythrin